jgi:hypothetical protein
MAKRNLDPTTEVPPYTRRKPLDTYHTFPAQEQQPTRTSFLVLPRIEGQFEGNRQSLFLHQLPEDILLAIAGWGLHWNKNDMQSLTNTCYRFATIFAPLRYKRYKDIGDTMMKAALMATYSSLRPADGNRKADPRLGPLVPFVERLFFVTAGIADEFLLADILYCRSIAKIRWFDQEWEEVTEEPDHKKDFCLHGITAIGVAAACGHWEIVRAILKSYMDDGLSDGNKPVCKRTKITPLHLAVEKDILLLHNTHLVTLFIGKSGQYPTTCVSPKYPAHISHRQRMCMRQLMKADASPWHHGKCSAHQQSLSFSSIDLANAPSNSGLVRLQKTAELLHNHIKQLLRRGKARSKTAFHQTQCWINIRHPRFQYRPAPAPVELSEENQALVTVNQSRDPGLTEACTSGPGSAVRKVPEVVKHLRTVIDKVDEWHYSPTDTKMPTVSLEPTPRGPHHLREPKARTAGQSPSNYLPKAATIYFVAPALWLTAQASVTDVAQSFHDQQNEITIESPPAVTTLEEDQSPSESKSVVTAIRITVQSNVLPERFPRDEGRTTSSQEDQEVAARSPSVDATVRLEDVGNERSSWGLSPPCQPDNPCWTLPNIEISATPFHAFACIDSLESALGSDGRSTEPRPGEATNDTNARPIFAGDSVVEQRGSPGFGVDGRHSGGTLLCQHVGLGAAQRRQRMPLSQMPLMHISLSHTETTDDELRPPKRTTVHSVPVETGDQELPGVRATLENLSINEPIKKGGSGEIFWPETEKSPSISQHLGVRNNKVLPDEELETLFTPGQLAESGTQHAGMIASKLGGKPLFQKQDTVPSVQVVALSSPIEQGDQLDKHRLAKKPLGEVMPAQQVSRKGRQNMAMVNGEKERPLHRRL